MAKKKGSISLDQGFKRKRRARIDTRAGWNRRYNLFLKAGFDSGEASWAATKGLSLRKSEVQDLVRHRDALIRTLVKYTGVTREQAVREAAAELRAKLRKREIADLNIFYEVSP